LYWTPVSPIHAVSFLANKTETNSWEIQYSLRVLEHFPADMIFFYVPQIVQLLRNDPLGNKFIIYNIMDIYIYIYIYNLL